MTGSRPITFLGTFPPPHHGMAIATASLANELEARGVELQRVDIMPSGGRGLRAKLTKARTIIATSFTMLLRPPTALLIGADAGFGLALQTAPLLAMRLRGRSVYVIHHSVVVPHAATATARLFVRVSGADVVHVFPCDRLVDEFVASFPATRSRTMVLSNGHVLGATIADAEELIRHDPMLSERQASDLLIRVGHLSNLDVDKGFGVVGDAVAILVEDGLSVHYLLAGQPVDSRARAELERIRGRLGERLVEVGFVEGSAKADFLASLDVFAHPSVYENECYSIAVWEALSFGVPVVTIEAGCLNPGVVREAGSFVEHQDANKVAAAIRELLGRGAKPRRSARELALADFRCALNSMDDLVNALTSHQT